MYSAVCRDLFVLLSLLFLPSASAFESPTTKFSSSQNIDLPPSTSLEDDAELRAKAERFHQALRNRPALGYLFDRFVDSWLEFSTTEALENFLQKQAANEGSLADHLILALFFSHQGNDKQAYLHFQDLMLQRPADPTLLFEKAQPTIGF